MTHAADHLLSDCFTCKATTEQSPAITGTDGKRAGQTQLPWNADHLPYPNSPVSSPHSSTHLSYQLFFPSPLQVYFENFIHEQLNFFTWCTEKLCPPIIMRKNSRCSFREEFWRKTQFKTEKEIGSSQSSLPTLRIQHLKQNAHPLMLLFAACASHNFCIPTLSTSR